MHCSRLVWNRTAEINFGLRPNFGLRLKSQTKLLVWDFSLRPKLGVTLLFALIRSQTGFLVSDQGLKLWFQRKIKWPSVYLAMKALNSTTVKCNKLISAAGDLGRQRCCHYCYQSSSSSSSSSSSIHHHQNITDESPHRETGKFMACAKVKNLFGWMK